MLQHVKYIIFIYATLYTSKLNTNINFIDKIYNLRLGIQIICDVMAFDVNFMIQSIFGMYHYF